MARKTIKRRAKNAAGGKNAPKQVKSAPRTASATSPPATSSGSSVPAVVPPPEPVTQALQPRKQKWTDLPEDSKIREKAAAIVALKIQGYDNDEIAEKIGLSVRSLRQYLWIAGKNGWLRTADPRDVADYEITHDVVKGLKELVTFRNDRGLPDKEVILKSAEGLGLFKDKHSDLPVNTNQNVLTINVVMPEGARQEIRPGTTGGAPAYVEAEVLDGPSKS